MKEDKKITRYDFQEATADRIAHIFRKSLIDKDGKEIFQGGQRRVLLADEVGLGKTHVAAGVIERVRKMRKEVGDDMFRVVYVCSNMTIANQNIRKLGITHQADVSESRLSMQHLSIRLREAQISDGSDDEMKEIIIPITPSTSFSRSGRAAGNIQERALIGVILTELDDFKPYQNEISGIFTGKAKIETREFWMDRYRKQIYGLGSEYISEIKGLLENNSNFHAVKSELMSLLNSDSIEYFDKSFGDIINKLRRIFADISLEMLQPDLIIMDEFQRFSSLLEYDNETEQGALVKKFFEHTEGREPLILLLSATPYKPYSTLEELGENNSDEHFDDFHRLMDFLFTKGGDFKEVWNDYSNALSHLSSETVDVVIASKSKAETKMYSAVSRTERLSSQLVKNMVVELPVSKDDVTAYCEMQSIIKACKEKSSEEGMHFSTSNMPVEYVKSAPYLLSMMDTYILKQQLEKLYGLYPADLPKPAPTTLLKADDILNFRRIPFANARLENIVDNILGKKDSELLLWLPPSMPYYSTSKVNPFEENKDFSKILVFSAWEIVPRMLSVMLTYEAERRVMAPKYSKNPDYYGTKGSERLRDTAMDILTEPSPFLASLYDKSEWFGSNIADIRKNIKSRIEEKLAGIPIAERRSYLRTWETMQWLDGLREEKPFEISSDTIKILTSLAIAGPGICLFRILGDIDTSRELAAGFASLFNKRIAGAIIDRIQRKGNESKLYLQSVADYCVMGNLQSVLDEYRQLCDSDIDFIDKMRDSFIDATTYRIDTDKSFGKEHEKLAMRSYYAVQFGKSKSADAEKTQQRNNNVRIAFNSPFYPFVLASTSVGQEGLDFHNYCRRITHWNLPSNPQDLEQREGRINRYKCLAIRRNLALFDPQSHNWDDLFTSARRKVKRSFGDKYSEMVPTWCLPEEWIEDLKKREENGEKIEWIERIVPQYPFSSDVSRYNRVKQVLTLYRLTMGQPRQEELVDMFSRQNLDQTQIDRLMFDLSPISRKRRLEVTEPISMLCRRRRPHLRGLRALYSPDGQGRTRSSAFSRHRVYRRRLNIARHKGY